MRLLLRNLHILLTCCVFVCFTRLSRFHTCNVAARREVTQSWVLFILSRWCRFVTLARALSNPAAHGFPLKTRRRHRFLDDDGRHCRHCNYGLLLDWLGTDIVWLRRRAAQVRVGEPGRELRLTCGGQNRCEWLVRCA